MNNLQKTALTGLTALISLSGCNSKFNRVEPVIVLECDHSGLEKLDSNAKGYLVTVQNLESENVNKEILFSDRLEVGKKYLLGIKDPADGSNGVVIDTLDLDSLKSAKQR